jgi:hypothetical protein
LAQEGRLYDTFDRVIDTAHDGGDQCTTGINFDPLRPKVDILRDYRRIVQEIYQPGPFFDRALRVALAMNCSQKRLKLSLWHHLRDLRGLANLIWQAGVKAPWRMHFWKIFATILSRNPAALRYALNFAGFYLHFGPFSRYVVEHIDRAIEEELQRPPAATAGAGNGVGVTLPILPLAPVSVPTCET